MKNGRGRKPMLDMKVARLAVDPFTDLPLVVLEGAAGQALSIWIGAVEASAIAAELEKVSLERPMTHDLMKTVLARAGVKVDRVEVTDYKDHAFYAVIHFTQGKKAIAVDARPSDAIALALRTGAPIRVAEEVLARHGNGAAQSPPPPDDLDMWSGDALLKLLESLSDEEFGKWKQ